MTTVQKRCCNVGSLGSKDGVLAIIQISGLYICVPALLKTLYKMLACILGMSERWRVEQFSCQIFKTFEAVNTKKSNIFERRFLELFLFSFLDLLVFFRLNSCFFLLCCRQRKIFFFLLTLAYPLLHWKSS